MFGFLKGKIEILIDNYNYKYGDSISGNVKLDLKKDFFANSVSIRLICDRKTVSYVGNTRSNNKQRIFDFKLPLDGKKQYLKEECPYTYDFKIDIPTNPISNENINKSINTIVNSINLLQGKNTVLNWYLLAKLDVSKSLFDISNKVQINIT